MGTKRHNDTWFYTDEDYDYSKEIQKAVDAGDFQKAAYLEKSRNAKIDYYGMPYEMTYDYQDHLPTAQNNKGSGVSAMPSFEKDSYAGKADRTLQKANAMNFNYNAQKDPLYKQIKSNYQKTAGDVIDNTMGSYAGMTGGVPSSYAVSAAAQAGTQHIQKADDMIPELYQLAYNKYADDKADLYRQYGIYSDLENQAYSRAVNEINRQYNFERDAIEDERYNMGIEAEKADKAQQDAYNRVTTMLSLGLAPDANDIAAAKTFGKVSPEALVTAYNAANAPKVVYSSGGSSGSADNENVSAMADYTGLLNYYSNGVGNNGVGEQLMTSFVIDKLKPYFSGKKTLDSNTGHAEIKKLILENTGKYNIDVDDARLVLETLGFPHVVEGGEDIYYSWLDDYEDRTGDEKYKGMKKK